MRVSLFIRSLHSGGAEKQSILIAKGLLKYFETDLVVLYNDGNLKKYASEQLNDDNIYFLKGNNIFYKGYSLFKYFKVRNPMNLVCFLPVNNILGLFVGWLTGVKYCYGGLRGSKIKNNRLKMLIQKILMNKLSTAVISNNYRAKDTYSEYGIKKNKIEVIHNGIDINNHLLKRPESDKISILTVGRFTSEKDYDTALNAFKRLAPAYSNKSQQTRYVIVGYGALEKKIRTSIRKLNLENDIDLIINPKDLSIYYLEADIFLLTSKFEGMPNTIMEAMSFSLPIVATDAGDAKYLVEKGVNGFICGIGDSVDISNRIRQLIDSYNLRIEFGINSYNKIKSDFSVEKMISHYVKLLDNNSQ